MAIEQIQKTQSVNFSAGNTAPVAQAQSQGQASALKKADTIDLSAEVRGSKPATRRDRSDGSHRLPYMQGSASGNIVMYYDSYTGELQAIPTAQGRIGLWKAGEDDPGDINKAGVCSLGLAFGSNGKTTIGSAYLAETVIDQDYGHKGRHIRLDVEFGMSHVRDGYVEHAGDMYGYNKDQVGYNTAHIGFDLMPKRNLNIMAGFDMSSMVFNPYIGVGGRWQSKDK